MTGSSVTFPDQPSDGSAATTPRQRQAILAVVALALMMVVSAVSGLNVALPGLARDTGASQRDLQWIVDAYTVVFAGLLLTAGAVGDRYGRQGILLAGLGIFGAAAAAAMFSDDPGTLIALRALMGAGAAAVMPVTLSIITTSFPPEERGRAVGLWVGVAGAGAVVGLLGSGVLLEFFDWNSFFGLNVTLAVFAFIGTLLVVPRSRDTNSAPLDGPGAVLSLVGVASIVFAIIEGPERGWTDGLTLGTFALGLAALAGFVGWELRVPAPILDPRLFRLRGFSAGSLTLTVQFFASFGFFFVVLQYLQFIVGFSPLEASLALLPLPAVLIPLARQAPAIADRFGMNRTTSLGLMLSAAGLAIISLVEVDLSWWVFLPGLLLFAAGMGLAATPATTAIVSSLPPERQGVASAVNDTSRELGSAIGIAVLGSLLNERYRSALGDAVAGLPEPVAEGAQEWMAFVGSDAVAQLGPAGEALADAARLAFVEGVGVASLSAAGVLAVAAAAVYLFGPRHSPETATTAGHDADGASDQAEAMSPTVAQPEPARVHASG